MTSRSESGPRSRSERPTAARTSSWRCWPTNSVTHSPRFATLWKSCGRRQDNGEAVHAASEMMERQIGQMARLVDDLLDVSRISRGKIELRRGSIELASAVNHAVEASRPLVESKGIDLRVSLPPEPIYLNADPIRLAQVVGNLLNNACKFTDKGGRIWLTVELANHGDQFSKKF